MYAPLLIVRSPCDFYISIYVSIYKRMKETKELNLKKKIKAEVVDQPGIYLNQTSNQKLITFLSIDIILHINCREIHFA